MCTYLGWHSMHTTHVSTGKYKTCMLEKQASFNSSPPPPLSFQIHHLPWTYNCVINTNYHHILGSNNFKMIVPYSSSVTQIIFVIITFPFPSGCYMSHHLPQPINICFPCSSSLRPPEFNCLLYGWHLQLPWCLPLFSYFALLSSAEGMAIYFKDISSL